MIRQDTNLESSPAARARPGRAPACATVRLSRSLARPTASISASTAGSAVPGRLREPGSVGRARMEEPSRARRASASRRRTAAMHDHVEVEIGLPRLHTAPNRPGGSKRRCRSPSCSRPRANRRARRLSSSTRNLHRQPLALVVDDEAARRASSRPRPAASTACAEQLAVAARAVGNRLHHRLAEGLGGNLAAQRLQQRQFLAARAGPRRGSPSVSKQDCERS